MRSLDQPAATMGEIKSCRLTHLTNAFSKKFESYQAAIASNFNHYNCIKTHGAIRMAPAQAAGGKNSAWTVTELTERYGK